MGSDKIRTRTTEELALRKKAFFEICDILEKLNIPYFLWGGVLLGAIRDHDFIEWDWDVELGFFNDDAHHRKDELVKAFANGGFEILRIVPEYENFKIDLAKYTPAEVSSFTPSGWYKEGDMWVRNLFKVPAEFFDTLDEMEFLGRTFKCPHDPEKFLEYEYGDWRTPVRSTVQADYMAPAFFREEEKDMGTFKKIKRNIKKTIQRLKEKM